MTFVEGLIKARSHIAFMLGLVVASAIVFELEKSAGIKAIGPVFSEDERSDGSSLPLAMPAGELTSRDMKAAEVAWHYFVNNTQPSTGLVNSVDAYEASTMWDQASYLLGLISAHRLGIVGKEEFDSRVSKLLESLARIKLFEGKLPNKVYNTRTLEMVNYQNEDSAKGIGWSAIDIARISVPLNIIVWNYPQHATGVKNIVAAWDFKAMIKDGVLFGARLDSAGAVELVQEGRLGYEEYAARAIGLMGIDTLEASRYDDYLKFTKLYGVKVAVDSREYAKYHAHNYVVSEPYILMGVEMGLDVNAQELAGRLLRAQQKRYEATGIETSVSEDNIDRPPYFVYNTLYANGVPWNAITEDGKDASEFRTVSTKAVFGWHALYNTSYTERLEDSISKLFVDKKGWYSGRYEKDGTANKVLTANSNGVILESLHYRKFGKLVAFYN
jgi:Protein of unknown function (DUF3131)